MKLNDQKFDKLTTKLDEALIKSGLKPHVQLLARDFAGAMACKHDLPSNARGFDVLRTVFQHAHDNVDRHTALRTLIQMIDAIDNNSDKLTSSVARKLAVAHFENTLNNEEPLTEERELAMSVQLFTRVATTKHTKLALAFHIKELAQDVETTLPEQSTNASQVIRDFMLNHEAEQRQKRHVLKLRPRYQLTEPVSSPAPDKA